ncbi:MAG: class I adenylate-forming enzyme family protein [Pseudomonadota bacterium]
MPVLLPNAAETTLGQALRAVAEARPDAPALLGEARQLTWSELDGEVDRLARLLTAVGVGPGDPVGVLTEKRPEVVTTFLACARIGALLCPVNFKLHEDRVLDQLQTIGMKTLLAERKFDPLLAHLAPALPEARRVIYVGEPGERGESRYDELESMPDIAVEHVARPEQACYLNFTSGTTGRPKGAVATHRNILANAVSGVEGFGFDSDDVFMGMFSVFSHPHELFHRSLVVGAPFVIWDTMSPRVVCQAVERFRVTWMMAVPSFYEMMLDFGGAGKLDLSSLRVLEAGGAWTSPLAMAELERCYGAKVMPVWGSTETTGVALAMPPHLQRLPGATGKPAPGYEIRVVTPSGADAAVGEVGELWVHGPGVAQGYLNRPEESARYFADGWYHTQDLVKVDAEGWVHFAGRLSEMMKIGGIRVYPQELEQVLGQHPALREVVVVRHEERLRGEVARAIVVTVPGSTLTLRELQRWCREHLAVYQVPRVIEFWRQIPRLPNGKVDKQRLLATPVDPQRDERD